MAPKLKGNYFGTTTTPPHNAICAIYSFTLKKWIGEHLAFVRNPTRINGIKSRSIYLKLTDIPSNLTVIFRTFQKNYLNKNLIPCFFLIRKAKGTIIIWIQTSHKGIENLRNNTRNISSDH